MEYKSIQVISRVDGRVVAAKLIVCECEATSFQIYIIHDHPHLQCNACGTTYCQVHSCPGVEEMEIQGN